MLVKTTDNFLVYFSGESYARDRFLPLQILLNDFNHLDLGQTKLTQ